MLLSPTRDRLAGTFSSAWQAASILEGFEAFAGKLPDRYPLIIE